MTSTAARDQPPPGIDPDYWRDFIAEMDAILERALWGRALSEAVTLARSPLPPLDPNVSPTRRCVRRRRPPLGRFVIPEKVLAAVAAHASTAAPGHEVVGRIVLRDEVATRYEPLVNRSSEPHRFSVATSWRPGAGQRSLICHSHPSSPATPSDPDLDYAARHHWEAFAIFAVATDTLAVFNLDEGGACKAVPVEVRADPPPEPVVAAAASSAPTGQSRRVVTFTPHSVMKRSRRPVTTLARQTARLAD